MLGEDEERLDEISIVLDPEDGRLGVLGLGEESTTAFTRLPYEQWHVPPRCRTMRPDWFLDEDAVMINVIEPEEAAVAYRVRSDALPLDPDGGHDYAIRSFGGKVKR
jgi:hypothetical protein